VFNTSAQWCEYCQEEATDMAQWFGTTGPNAGNWAALGVQFVTLLIEDNDSNPASATTAQEWRSAYPLSMITVCADPDPGSFAYPNLGLPNDVLVDPRTMKVVNSSLAGGNTQESPDPAIAALATQNE
jgi:hypothetical protein